MKQNAFLLLTLLFSLPSLAADEAAAPEGEEVAEGELLSRYWLAEPVTLAASLAFPQHLFSIGVPGATDDNAKNVDFSPPQSTDLSISAAYGPFQFSWKFALPKSSSTKAQYGDGEYNDFKLEFGRDRIATSLYYQTFRGFFTDLNGNSGSYARVGTDGSSSNSSSGSNASTGPSDIVKRPDIRTRHYGAIGWYAFPLSSGGPQAFQSTFNTLSTAPDTGFHFDLATNLFYDRSEIRSGMPLIPQKKAALFSEGAQLTGVDFHSAGAGIGIVTSYAFAESNYFLDGLLTYGGGVQRQRAEYTQDTRWSTAYVDNVNFRFGANYQAELKRAGLHFWVNTLGSRVSDVRVNSSNMAIELSYQQTI